MGTALREMLAVVAMACAFAFTPSARGRAPERGAWVDAGPVPGAAEGYRPQGMALAGSLLLFTDHRHDTGSSLFVLDRHTFALRANVPMPRGVTHPGGLAWDGTDLWAVDYNSNRLYRIDLRATLATGRAVVRESYPTRMHGTSAIAAIRVDGKPYLAISDYGAPGLASTCLLRRDRLRELARAALERVADVCYDNGGLSQGLASDGTLLYESINAVGRDRIRALDVRSAVRTHDAHRIVEVASFAAPGDAVEDLETDGETLWTSDEESFHFYAMPGLAALRSGALWR